MFESYYEKLTEFFTVGDYYQDIYNAKQEFFEKSGVVYEEDPEYETRMCLFMDWYLFERDLPGVDLPPAKLYLRTHRAQMDEETIKVFSDMTESIHSIFKVRWKRFFSKGLIVEDLFSRKTYSVNDPKIKQSFSWGDIFEGRIIPFKGELEFSRGFCFHPSEMRRFIMGEIKKVRYQDKTKHTKLIFQLSNMKLKHSRYNHIDVTHIYRLDSKF